MAECLFCKIVAKEIPAAEVHRDETAVAFRDIDPKAPHHLLIVPTQHAANLSAFIEKAGALPAGRLLALASQLGCVSGDGYRVVINEGTDGGQTVEHLHLHVFAGRRMSWPPG